ncbi:Ketosamine-3-kinase [Hondaea fermentalgiana]|uniref:protein-ribulosamine 3-kinase n=1 Tax=Hondaea fermentalgiana TaxID=2315210 RepID=A0A2R5GKB8_9STRA|nr:Ketosamine-3-kinase [Hondaea fermentalgiana]|eukprot:GBG29073.1 Ketosamine-3-kinase [Hondaea fermentalgiana]
MKAVATQLEAAGHGPVEIEASRTLRSPSAGRVFVKFGTGGADADISLLEYERLGLEHLRHSAPKELKVPKALLAGETSDRGGFVCVEHLDLGGRLGDDMQAAFGKALATMHAEKQELHAGFGFPVDGCCGALEQPNNSEGRSLNWVEFWDEFRLGFQLEEAKRRYPEDVEMQELGAQLRKRLPILFSDLVIEDIKPSILHGDLWSGNVGVTEGKPCIFDPAAYYGHAEADLGIAYMFGGFSQAFFEAYHAVLPREPGFEQRAKLYELHHHLNHMNIFGSSYRGGCVQLMQQLVS